MFGNCSSLNQVKIHWTWDFEFNSGFGNQPYFTRWMDGVQTTSGTFYYNGTTTTRGASYIPSNWTITTF